MPKFIKKLVEGSKGKQIDFTLLFTLLVLLAIGIIVLSSASSYYALTQYNNSSYYLTRQLFFAVAGVVIMLVVSMIDYRKYLNLGYLGYISGIILMLMVFIPHVGRTVKGATRWIYLGFTNLQPSEVMKVLLIIAISTYIVKNQKKVNTWKGYIVPVIMIGIVCVIMYFQSHLSGALVMIVIGAITIFASGFKLKTKVVVTIGLIGVVAVSGFLFSEDYRLERVKAFLNPEADIRGSNWQPTQSLYAIGSGGLFGKGLGQSRQKYLWLPEAQNDFVFSVLGEEFGFLGSALVIGLFAFFILRGITIALKSKDLFGMLLVAGIIGMFAFQIVVNIAVVTKTIPTTGMPLPFFSSGGTSLLINLAAMGIVFNVSRQGK